MASSDNPLRPEFTKTAGKPDLHLERQGTEDLSEVLKPHQNIKPQTLAIFDYSGTLSLDAVEFGRPDSLQQHLEKSGLAGIGIDTPDRYWQAVVNPTWPLAGTTAEAFSSIAADCIQKLAGPGTRPTVIRAAAGKFVEAYLRRSVIDARWRPLLVDIQQCPDTVGLIATDHYAEATAAIGSHLATLGIAVAPTTGAESNDGGAGFIVANSADIGCLKADRRFWLTLQETRLDMPVKKVLLVDDFGSNEPDHSGYAQARRIETRIDATRQALGDVFEVKPQIIHFQAGQDVEKAIRKTSASVKKALQL